MKPSGVILLEGNDAAKREEQTKNVAHFPSWIHDYTPYATSGPSPNTIGDVEAVIVEVRWSYVTRARMATTFGA